MIQQFGSNVMKGLMVVGAALVFSGGSAEAVVTNYVEFGKTAMDSAPPLIKAADTLTKARYIAQMVGEQMKADGIPPNTHFGGRIRALGSEGNCGDCASRIQDAMKGAGLTMDGQSRIPSRDSRECGYREPYPWRLCPEDRGSGLHFRLVAIWTATRGFWRILRYQ